MNYTKIKVSVSDQNLIFEELPKLASGGIDEVQITVTFDDVWNGLEKTAVFYRTLGAVYHIPIDETDSVVVPYEVMKNQGNFWFGIFGENETGAVRTTEVKQLYVVQGAAIENETGYEPTPDIYAEILAAAKNAEAIAQSVRDDADAGLFGGNSGDLPTKLPNSLVINGTIYDGSSPVNIELMNWRGEWKADTEYQVCDVVTCLGTLFICMENKIPIGEMPWENEGWALLAEKSEFDASNYYKKIEIDAMLGSYITDIDTLVGGDA